LIAPADVGVVAYRVPPDPEAWLVAIAAPPQPATSSALAASVHLRVRAKREGIRHETYLSGPCA
jgi:hypothetical protein